MTSFRGGVDVWELEDASEITKWDSRITVIDQFPMFKNIPRDSLGADMRRFMDYSDESGRGKYYSLASLARSSGSAVCQALYGPIFANNKSTFKKVAFFCTLGGTKSEQLLMRWKRSARNNQQVPLLSRRSVSRQLPVEKVR